MLDNFSHYLFEYFFSCTLFLHFLECPWYQCWMCCCCCSSTESCLTLCDPMGCSTLCSPVLYYLRSLLRVLFIESVMLSYMTVSYSEAAFFCLQSFTAPEIFCYHSTDLRLCLFFFPVYFLFIVKTGSFPSICLYSFIPCYLQTTLELILWVFISVIVSFSLIISNLLFL